MKVTKVQRYQRNYHNFNIQVPSQGDTVQLLAMSDVHFDNPKCNRELFFRHLDEAKAKGAFIAIHGDFFCLMQGKYDRRSNKAAILPEHLGDNYLDLVINDAAEKLRPYAENILIITSGNHESSVSQRNETHILDRFVERLNLLAGTNIQAGAYDGYYTLTLSCHKRKRTVHVGYSHGRWGGVITKGALGVVRYAAYMPDCDIHFTGHTHDAWVMTQPRMKRDSQSQKVYIETQWHVKTGTYKEEFGKGEGWAVEKIGMPKRLGGCWVNIKVKREKLEFGCTLTN